MANIPFSINWQRWQSYLLQPDEIALLEFLLFRHNGHNLQPFYIGRDRREAITHIKRNRQQAILKKFCDLGFLRSEQANNDKGRVTYYNIDYAQLSKVIGCLINPDSDLFKEYNEFAKLQASTSVKVKKKPIKMQNDMKIKNGKKIKSLLDDVYSSRCAYFNETAERKKPATQLAFTQRILEKLGDLGAKYSTETIERSAIAFFDKCLRDEDIKHPLAFFTMQKKGEYPKFNYFLDVFQQRYGHD